MNYTPPNLIKNPDYKELRQLVLKMPTAKQTSYGNINVKTNVLARSKACTYIVSDSPQEHSDQTMSRHEAQVIEQLQNDYMKKERMIQIDGYIGEDPEHRVAARLWVESQYANIAAMQQQLYFTPSSHEWSQFQPQLQVIYTPGLQAPASYLHRRAITVDLQTGITRVLNSDYFGESKKGGLRMWNQLMYERGGLAMHAGCKVVPTGNDEKVVLIIGLSGTGKTTTTFTRTHHSYPVQDDFVAWTKEGKVISSENGCFAKTFGLSLESEPLIYKAVTHSRAYLENVSQDPSTQALNFFDETYTQNGRATFSFDDVPEIPSPVTLPRVDVILILNRNENIIPGVARLSPVQAAAYFMLGETKGTAAGGAEEAGKALRIPGTNPFFPLLHSQQGMRFLELLEKYPAEVYLMNTGWVGGPSGTSMSQKVKIEHSAAIVNGIINGDIQWKTDPEFGYEIASRVPGMEDSAAQTVLNPKSHYANHHQEEKYMQLVATLKQDRQAHLLRFSGLPKNVIAAVGG